MKEKNYLTDINIFDNVEDNERFSQSLNILHDSFNQTKNYSKLMLALAQQDNEMFVGYVDTIIESLSKSSQMNDVVDAIRNIRQYTESHSEARTYLTEYVQEIEETKFWTQEVRSNPNSYECSIM